MSRLTWFIITILFAQICGKAGYSQAYVDIDPDSIINNSNNVVNLDIDDDLENDIQVSYFNPANIRYFEIYPFSSNEMRIASENENNFRTLNFGDTISGKLRFSPTQSEVYSDDCSKWDTNWTKTTDGYIGFLFIRSVVHFGWIRFDITDSSKNMIIKDYAFSNEDDTFIIAGKGVPKSIDEIEIPPLVHSSSGITIPNTFDRYEIFTLSGVEIKSENTSGEAVQIPLKPGFYIVRVQTKGLYKSYKVILQ